MQHLTRFRERALAAPLKLSERETKESRITVSASARSRDEDLLARFEEVRRAEQLDESVAEMLWPELSLINLLNFAGPTSRREHKKQTPHSRGHKIFTTGVDRKRTAEWLVLSPLL